MINYQQYISIDSQIRFGKPVISGTRISVYDVIGWLASAMSQQEILADFPELDKPSIQACLAFVAERENRINFKKKENQCLSNPTAGYAKWQSNMA